MENKEVKYDLDGYEAVTPALLELINQFPGLYENEKIYFSDLSEDGGIALMPLNGSIIETERKSVTGKVYQTCQYPFFIIYRVAAPSSARKQAIKEWLDTLGKWVEKQKISIGNEEYKLSEYPQLTENREFLSIKRQSPSYLYDKADNGIEDWAIYITARYSNEFKM